LLQLAWQLPTRLSLLLLLLILLFGRFQSGHGGSHGAEMLVMADAESGANRAIGNGSSNTGAHGRCDDASVADSANIGGSVGRGSGESINGWIAGTEAALVVVVD
jgi:hypothetical protein